MATKHIIALLPFKEFGETFQTIMEVIRKAELDITIAGNIHQEDLKDYPFAKQVIYIPDPEKYSDENGEFFKALDACYREKPFTAIINFFEEYVELAAAITERFGLNGNSRQTAFLTRNKYAMRQELSKHGLDVPRFIKAGDRESFMNAIREIGFPCVVKPVDAMASEGVLKLEGPEKMDGLYEKLLLDNKKVAKSNKHDLLVEQYIAGPEISLEAVVSAGELHIMGITEKTTEKEPFFNEIMHIHPAQLEARVEELIFDTGRRAVKALGIRFGGVHLEARISSGKVFIIEVASRLGGDAIPALMSLSKGYDPYGYVFKSGLDETLVLKQTRNKFAGIRFIQSPKEGYLREIFFDEDLLSSVPGVINKRIFGKVGELIARPPKGRTNRLAYITIAGRSYEAVREQLLYADRFLKYTID